MAYIGQAPFQEFASIPTKDSFTGDGSTTTFDLANDVVRGAENALEVFVNNVRQEPGSGKAFTLGVDGSNNYRRITFTAAPASSAAIYVINDKTNLSAIAPINTDFNGAELVLDADGDTTLHASTDDIIDLRIAGSDVLKFAQSSGDAIIKNATDAKDLIFQQADGNKLFEINDGNFVGVGGNSTAPGEIRIFEDTDNGSNYSGFKAAASTTSSVAYQLPAADGSSGTHLTTDGSGVLSWTASVSLANDTNNRVITGTGSGLNGEANLTFDGSTLAVTGAITGSGDLTLQDDLILDSDAAVLSFGEDNEIALTHVADTGLLLTDSGGTPTLQFHDANESISSDGTDLTLAAGADINLTATTDINIPSNVGLTFGNDGEKIEGDGTDLTIAGNNINLTATADVVIPANVGITFGTGEKIEGDSTDLTITSGAKINLTATSDVHLPNNVGIVFGDAAEKIEGDGTDLTIAGNNIKLTAATDVIIPTNVGLHFTDANEKIESDGTDLTINAGADINLTATTDINVPSGVGLTFGDDGEKIEGDGTDLTIAGNNINLTAVADVVIPNNVGIQFGGASEKIEGDGTDLVISANNLTVDAAADITLDSGGNDLNFAAGGTTVLTITNSSSDVIIKPVVDAKDLIFQQRDGTEVMRIEDGAHVSFAAAAVNPEVALSDGANVAWNTLTSPVAKVTLGGNRNLSAGSGGIAGAFQSLLVIQDGTGSRTLTFNAVYEFKNDTAPVLTTAANKGDLFVFRYNGSKFLEVGRNQNLTLS